MTSTFFIRASVSFMITVVFLAYSAQAQFIEDALRFIQDNGYGSSRAGGLGVAYNGVSDDFAAIAYNPAGLSLVRKSEITFGLDFLRQATTTTFLGRQEALGSNSASPTHIGIVAPFSTKQGAASIAIGYVYENSFFNTSSFGGFNQSSSIVQSLMNETNVLGDNLAFQAYLADTAGGKLHTPINGNLWQQGFIRERGGIHNLSGGAGFDLTPNVSLGFTITGKWGSYSYSREYRENDILNVYNKFDPVNFSSVDFNNLTLTESIEQQISGLGGTLGIMGRVENFLRFGLAVKTPTFYQVDEHFSRTLSAVFDDNSKNTAEQPNTRNSYNITTPFTFSAGLSMHLEGLTFAAGAEYRDVTQLQFSDAAPSVERLNIEMLRTLVGQTVYGFGAEYEIPASPFIARASYTGITSPYARDIAGAKTDILALGGGIYLAPNIRLDVLFRKSSVSELRVNYGDGQSQYIVDERPLQISAQFTYRY